MRTKDIRIGERRDYHPLVFLRGAWLDRFYGRHPLRDRWCPACCPVPIVEGERELFLSLAQRDGRWAAICEDSSGPCGYVLCMTDHEGNTVGIVGQTPRIFVEAEQRDTACELIRFVLQRSSSLRLSVAPQ